MIEYSFEVLNTLDDETLQKLASACEVILMNRAFLKGTLVSEHIMENENAEA